MTERIRDVYADEVENRRKLQQWREQKKAEAEEQDRTQKRAALEAHLAERARTFYDHTGTTPTTATLERWKEAYVDSKQREVEAERAERLAESIRENYR
jgi:hypothetical protein